MSLTGLEVRLQDEVVGGFPNAIELSPRGCAGVVPDTLFVCRALRWIWNTNWLPVATGVGDAGSGQEGAGCFVR